MRGTAVQKWDLPSRYDRKAEKKRDADAAWLALCKLVDARDRKVCRCCGRHADPHALNMFMRGERHHIIYRSAGGQHVSENVALICSRCHSDEHAHRLRIEGNADERLTFWRRDDEGEWFMFKRETAVGVSEID